MTDEPKTTPDENPQETQPEDEVVEEEKKDTNTEELEEKIDPEKVVIETRGKLPEEKKVGKDKEEEEEIDPEDQKTIGKVVEDRMADFRGAIDEVQTIKDQQEVTNYLLEKPEYKQYKDVILKYLAHPVYKSVPVENIVRIVAGNDMKKIGARMEREAVERAKATRSTGTTVRQPQSGKTDWLDASKEAFEKKKNEVLGIR